MLDLPSHTFNKRLEMFGAMLLWLELWHGSIGPRGCYGLRGHWRWTVNCSAFRNWVQLKPQRIQRLGAIQLPESRLKANQMSLKEFENTAGQNISKLIMVHKNGTVYAKCAWSGFIESFQTHWNDQVSTKSVSWALRKQSGGTCKHSQQSPLTLGAEGRTCSIKS